MLHSFGKQVKVIKIEFLLKNNHSKKLFGRWLIFLEWSIVVHTINVPLVFTDLSVRYPVIPFAIPFSGDEGQRKKSCSCEEKNRNIENFFLQGYQLGLKSVPILRPKQRDFRKLLQISSCCQKTNSHHTHWRFPLPKNLKTQTFADTQKMLSQLPALVFAQNCYNRKF